MATMAGVGSVTLLKVRRMIEAQRTNVDKRFEDAG